MQAQDVPHQFFPKININNQEIKANITAAISNEINQYHNLTPWLVKKIHEKIPELITQACQPYGYYHPSITSEMNQVNHDFFANYRVELGDAMQVTASKIDGIEAILPHLSGEKAYQLNFGHNCDSLKYSEAKTSLIEDIAVLGYVNAQITQSKMLVNLDQNTCEVNITIDPGIKYDLGHIQWHNHYIASDFLDQYINFKAGTPYDRQLISDLRNNLIKSGYFSDVIIQTSADVAEQLLNFDIQTIDILPRTTDFLIAYDSDSQINSELTYTIKPFTAFGHSLSTNIDIAKHHRKFKLNYATPGTDPATTSWNYNLELKQEDINSSIDSSHQELSVLYAHKTSVELRQTSLSLLRENDWNPASNRYEQKIIMYPKVVLQNLHRKVLLNKQL